MAQEQTVEEILASIRQVINGDQQRVASGEAKPEVTPPPARRVMSAAGLPRNGGTVTSLLGGKTATPAVDASGAVPANEPADDLAKAEADAEADGVPMHDVIEMAIEEALGGLHSDPTRVDAAGPAATEPRLPLRAALRPPRLESRLPAREATEPARSEPHPSAPREAPRLDARPAQPTPRAASPARSLLSARANAAVAASFDDLARVLGSRGARQIDQAVEDLLRPMLKVWLEDNLPALVERLVREEIERVSRGGR